MHVKNHFALIPWQFQSKSLQTLWEFEYWGFERSWWFFSITYIAIKVFHLVNNNYSICGCQLGKSRTMNRGKKNNHKQKASTSWQVNNSSKIKICKYAIAIHLNNGEIFFSTKKSVKSIRHHRKYSIDTMYQFSLCYVNIIKQIIWKTCFQNNDNLFNCVENQQKERKKKTTNETLRQLTQYILAPKLDSWITNQIVIQNKLSTRSEIAAFWFFFPSNILYRFCPLFVFHWRKNTMNFACLFC